MTRLTNYDIAYDGASRQSTITVKTWESPQEKSARYPPKSVRVLVSLHDTWTEDTCLQVPQIVAGHPLQTGQSIAPGPTWLWNCDQLCWVDTQTLEGHRITKWAEIKDARSAAEYGGFTWNGSTFDSDAISQARIQGAVQLASMAPDFSTGWTLADNSVRALSAADMLAVGMALGVHVALQFSRAQALRVLIEAAETVEMLAALGW